MARVAGMVEDGEPDRAPIDLTGEVRPFGALAPHQFLAGFVLCVDELAGPLWLRNAFRLLRLERRGKADGEHALFGVAEGHLFVGRKGDVEIDDARLRVGGE